jgi:hypothetical protein
VEHAGIGDRRGQPERASTMVASGTSVTTFTTMVSSVNRKAANTASSTARSSDLIAAAPRWP